MMNFTRTELGQVCETNDVVVFFGNKSAEATALQEAFPDVELVILNQTHSDHAILTQAGQPKLSADAHYTKEKKLALCIRTADCIPVMLHDPTTGWIAGIHAGWRGVENQIIIRTLEKLQSAGADLTKTLAWIGPHIRRESFEVGLDVAQSLEEKFQLVSLYSSAKTATLPHVDSSKAYMDLALIARAQLRSFGIEPQQVTELAIDTFKSDDHVSFRRDKNTGGRQISFIYLK